jgi:hypothetical protein
MLSFSFDVDVCAGVYDAALLWQMKITPRMLQNLSSVEERSRGQEPFTESPY